MTDNLSINYFNPGVSVGSKLPAKTQSGGQSVDHLEKKNQLRVYKIFVFHARFPNTTSVHYFSKVFRGIRIWFQRYAHSLFFSKNLKNKCANRNIPFCKFCARLCPVGSISCGKTCIKKRFALRNRREVQSLIARLKMEASGCDTRKISSNWNNRILMAMSQ